jgi:hypothetical protein
MDFDIAELTVPARLTATGPAMGTVRHTLLEQVRCERVRRSKGCT